MVYLEIRERIGNQLFQYAFARKMAIKFCDELAINFDQVIGRNLADQGWVNKLEDYALYPYKDYQLSQYAFYQKAIIKFLKRKLSKMNDIDINKYLLRIENMLNRLGIFYLFDGFYDFKEPFGFVKDKILIGYFESSKYFSDVDSVIRQELVPKHSRVEENARLYDLMDNTESVCVSIRRGDFLSEREINNIYICDEKYFYDAIEKIQQMLKDIVFFIFSDDIEWVRENMHFPGTVYYETGKDPTWEKLRMMSHCKHFIISNSTFSWWAQHLSPNSNKIVIAPEIWRKDGRTVDIYEDDWIRISVDRGSGNKDT